MSQQIPDPPPVQYAFDNPGWEARYVVNRAEYWWDTRQKPRNAKRYLKRLKSLAESSWFRNAPDAQIGYRVRAMIHRLTEGYQAEQEELRRGVDVVHEYFRKNADADNNELIVEPHYRAMVTRLLVLYQSSGDGSSRFELLRAANEICDLVGVARIAIE